jgi:hypothetical protein
MASEKDLLLALEFVTEGAEAVIPEGLARRAFAREAFVRATERLKAASRDWTQGRGIQGLGIGEKITAGKAGKELALRVYVEKKLPKAAVKNLAPRTVNVPEVGEVPTDVLEIGRVELESFTRRARPAMPGVGVGHPDVTVGTFGCLVRRRGQSGLFILSNSHVLADEGVARINDDILQPGSFDRGRVPGDRIARLAAFQPFEFTATGFPNLVDAAVARVERASSVSDVLRILGVKPVGVSFTVSRGMKVQKVGRTTDFTTGEIQDVNVRLALTYKRPGHESKFFRRRGHTRTGRVGLRDQVLCTRYTAGGDSGSAVLNSSKRVVGLHFAGSPSSSIFNRIEHVFAALDLELA